MFKESDPRSQVRMTVIVMQITVCKPDLLRKLFWFTEQVKNKRKVAVLGAFTL